MEKKFDTTEERQKYVEAWNTTMTQIWQERIRKLGVYEMPRRKYRRDEPHLFDELRYFPVKHDDTYMQLTLHFSFPEYGIFRERRRWFSIKWYSSVMNMRDFMARSIGKSFVGICATTFEQLNKYN